MYTDHFSIYPRLLNMTLIYNTYDKYACVYCDKKYNQHHIKSKMKNIKMATKLFPTHTHTCTRKMGIYGRKCFSVYFLNVFQ